MRRMTSCLDTTARLGRLRALSTGITVRLRTYTYSREAARFSGDAVPEDLGWRARLVSPSASLTLPWVNGGGSRAYRHSSRFPDNSFFAVRPLTLRDWGIAADAARCSSIHRINKNKVLAGHAPCGRGRVGAPLTPEK